MMQHKKIVDMVEIALFAAVLCILSQISIPTPWGVPFTLQTLAVALTAYTLGWKKGTLSVAVYLALGAVGLPVFSSFGSGIATLVGMTGGYLWGFLGMAALCGRGADWAFRDPSKKHTFLCILFSILGLAACHIPGVLQFALVSDSTLGSAFLVGSAPYLLKDAVSMVLAFGLATAIRKAVRHLPSAQKTT